MARKQDLTMISATPAVPGVVQRMLSAAAPLVLLLATVVMTSAGALAADGSAEVRPGVYRYRTAIGEEQGSFLWQKSGDADEVVITVQDYGNERLMVNHCRPDGATVGWRLREGDDTDITARRRADILELAGTFKGQPVERTHTLDSRPWYQPLSFSLTSFLQGSQDSVAFWSVRQDTLELVSLEAARVGTEALELNGTTVSAIRVEVRLQGFLAPFWHGTYWYRQSNGQFLRYSAVNGPPGTPRTVIELIGRLGG